MPRPPYINFPFSGYRPSYGMQRNFRDLNKNAINSNYSSTSIPSSSNSFSEINHEERDNRNYAQKNKSNKYNDDYLFDLFGLKIYSDDVLLVSLIYFLYSEDVKDDGLFIVLILLLIS